MSLNDILPLVSDPSGVAAHKFMPLLHFSKKWRRAPLKRAGKAPIKRDPKVRNIRYACRKDTYIFKYYRELLSERYEAFLAANKLESSVLAYRRIPVGGRSNAHKSNIEFARDAFSEVDRLGKCCAVAIDISDFFGSMSHSQIKNTWKRLLSEPELPNDHFAVFRALTRFHYVDRDEAYVALGYSERTKSGVLRYKNSPKKIPRQICSNSQFREAIVENGLVNSGEGSAIGKGIPQGVPLSDLIANAYLTDFDICMRQYAERKGGTYCRYSDDILFILPGDGRAARAAFNFAAREITKHGDHLKIKPSKTEIACYTPGNAKLRCCSMAFDESSNRLYRHSPNSGLSYLGFRYDGRLVYLRTSTISNLRGKIFRSCSAVAINHVDRHLDKDLIWLLSNIPLHETLQRFFQIKDYDDAVSVAENTGKSPFSKMTFWSYSKRATNCFGARGRPIEKQTKKVKKQVELILSKLVIEKYQTRSQRLMHKHGTLK